MYSQIGLNRFLSQMLTSNLFAMIPLDFNFVSSRFASKETEKLFLNPGFT